jgi:hypothetical protein
MFQQRVDRRLTKFVETRKLYHLVKRKQALLGSNLPRDNRIQVALNHAAGGDALIVFPTSQI